MADELLKRAYEILRRALDLNPVQRSAFLEKKCGDASELRELVEGLLADVPPEDSSFESASELTPPGRAQDTEREADTTLLDSSLGDNRTSVGHFKIIEKLGEGGMGEVLLAEQTEPVRRRVALKIIKLGMDTKEVVARFEAERQALALMDHPNIAKVYDAGSTDQGRPYFAMEYIRGVTITDHCDRERVAIRERLELFARVCDAVQHAHQKGIIHRDIKPSNVLVKVEGDQAVPKIIDFGVSKAINQRLTEQTVYTELGHILGTPAYMSPEQAETTAQDIDTRTDIYSLGVLLYELLVGTLPFDPASLLEAGYEEMKRIIREVDPPKPSTRISGLGDTAVVVAKKRKTDMRVLTRNLHGDLDWITMKALAKERTRRYATASEFAADIARHLNHEPVLASPPSVSYRLGKFLRKYRGPVSAAAAVVMMLIAGLLGTLVMYTRSVLSEKELAKALTEKNQALEEVLQLSDIKRLRDCEKEADKLWPCVPDKVSDMQAWLDEARKLADDCDGHEASLKKLRSEALLWDEAARRKDRNEHPEAGRLKQLQERKAKLAEEVTRLSAEIGPDAKATLISFGADLKVKPISYYFRHSLDVEMPHNDAKLTLSMAVDDGALVYLNGIEFWRVNMPDGAVTSDTLAAATVNDPMNHEHVVPRETLRPGKNLVAAEVHQADPLSSDVHFALQLVRGEKVLISSSATWKYADSSAGAEVNWKRAGYDDSAWPSGPAPLGFGFKDGRGRLLELEEAARELGKDISALEESVSERRTWAFDNAEDRWRHEVLSQLVEGLKSFRDPRTGVLADVEKRLEFARTVYQRSVKDHDSAWNQAIASIGNVEECPKYKGLRLTPQVGLVPIGKDPESGLWEFAHLQTGSLPTRDSEGKIILTEQTGLVFVLIPGGSFSMGAMKPSEEKPQGSPNVDPKTQGDEGPVHEVALSPFFLSKYEMTQGQWLRFTGDEPSVHGPDGSFGDKQRSLMHPVEQVSWEDCEQVLGRLGLLFPTEAQWEYAARAGTTTVWWTGNDRKSISGAGNLADRFYKENGASSTWRYEEWLDDGYSAHAPVGSYRANGFGLHDTIGNVLEWCQDWYGPYGDEAAPGNGQRKSPDTRVRVRRGGSFLGTASDARSANRSRTTSRHRYYDLGLRPAIAVTTSAGSRDHGSG